jgi:carbon monoxide dehydrogenase subunit G
MKLEQSFEVDAPLERVWQALIDVERVAPCLPGAAITGRNDDGSYNGTFKIKIGPTTASYTGKLEMENVDEDVHRATMQAQGSDKRGQGGAKATIVSTLSAANGSTRVEVVTDYHITGRLARFGRGGMIEDISERLLREFAGCLQSSLGKGETAGAPEAPEAPEPLEAPEPEQVTEDMPAGPVDTGAPAPTEAADAPPPAEADAPPSEAAALQAASEVVPPPPPVEAAPPPVEAASAPPVSEEAPTPPPVEPAPPVEGLSLLGSVMLARARRNPRPLLGALGALLFLRFLRRRRR